MNVFAREWIGDGRRYFIAEDIENFFGKYKNMRNNERTFYEIIRGSYPYRLYFDLE